MSLSPPVRLSTSSSRQEDLINAYEAEEERIMNLLSRKLEQLREDKIGLENALEAESESHVNRLSRELTALRLAQQRQQQENGGSSSNGISTSPEARFGPRDPLDPTLETMLEALRIENERLRTRLVSAERSYIRVSRLNDIYREELIDHRRRLGLAVDDLIGHSSDALSQPTHRRTASLSGADSPTSVVHYPSPGPSRPALNGVPIPRPTSQLYRPVHNHLSETNTPLSHSPSSADSPSPFPISPVTSTNPASYVSTNTNITSPGSSDSWTIHNAMIASQTLTYPSVPPPSLASSVGSPTISTLGQRSRSPAEPLSRRNSMAGRRSQSRTADSTNLRSGNPSGSRVSVERGGRVAETGTLMPRSRAGSHSINSNTTEAPSANRAVRGIRVGGFRIGFFDSGGN
ncbi:hypothetical protein AGABI2DRAFT_120500 [Agaricus bisporus var. bisporus H97]|uniref:hypothetical protein n=1 Tax=Agaricus bisporus var. bisporus (strain H97 / ATCC MYA-4626 / FGSC 10389) TaxID=936046 RepID=UPI00029F7834|nr:hypothetical protein AGABI2DRAFT_120500 [Agaricus bisporus var. bisporus H97]EKV44370.1 hypothetical protein AGABI2DRAFT_120500 [Agaricus bisporus var. bisporus H97]